MSIKRSGDGVEPAYLDRCNQRRKAAPCPPTAQYIEVLNGGSPGHCKAMQKVATGPTYGTANFFRRKE